MFTHNSQVALPFSGMSQAWITPELYSKSIKLSIGNKRIASNLYTYRMSISLTRILLRIAFKSTNFTITKILLNDSTDKQEQVNYSIHIRFSATSKTWWNELYEFEGLFVYTAADKLESHHVQIRYPVTDEFVCTRPKLL
jgi:hypothetical protein